MNELATTNSIQTLDDLERVAKSISASGMFGLTKPEQAFTLMLVCQSEGLNPIAALKRFHIIEGRPSMRADAMQAEFLARGGAIIFHVRTDEMVAATLFADKTKLDDAARTRAAARFEILWNLDCETDDSKRPKLMVAASKLSMEGEETIIRTFADCQAKGLTNGRDGIKANWKSSPRQMLTARVITEGVRLVNPGLIAGIYSEDETADIVRQEREATARMLESPTATDCVSILEIIAGYDKELETAEGTRRKTLLGLRSDLVCKLGDIGAKAPIPPPEPSPTVGGQPANTVEVVEVQTVVETPKRTAKPKPAPVEAETQPINTLPTDWREVVNTRVGIAGQASGQMLGKTLADIFSHDKDAKRIKSRMDIFEKSIGRLTAPCEEDAHLWRCVQAANAAWQEAQATASPAPATSETPTPAQKPEATPSPNVAQPTGWRGHVIESKNPAINGKALGELPVEGIQAIKTDYLDKLPDPSRMTLAQKKLAAMVGMALAELNPSTDLPPAANADEQSGLPEHTVQLLDAIESSQLNRNDFMKICRENSYISSTATRPEDITEAEFVALSREWPTVVADVKKAQP